MFLLNFQQLLTTFLNSVQAGYISFLLASCEKQRYHFNSFKFKYLFFLIQNYVIDCYLKLLNYFEMACILSSFFQFVIVFRD